MEAFEYASPATLREALDLLGQDWQGARILAGGTDLLALMKEYIESPKRIVNIKAVRELEGIRMTSAGLRIGALVTLDELSKNAEVRTEYPSLAEAARGVASMQTRNMGTVGGDLCQRPRCWYFRLGYGLMAKGKDGQSLVPNGDNRYHAIFGNQGPAYFVSASSFGPPLAALGAKVKLASASGVRELPIEKFFVTPQDDSARETALRPEEILTEIVVPAARGAHNATYEIRQKTALDWPLATASVVLKMRGTSVSEARVVLGHVAPTPWSAEAAGKVLAGKALTPAVAEEAGKAAAEGATPLSGNGYKVQLVRTAVKRALLEAAHGKA
jgi:xanthine dehydrogenase YagS FAD-binding subunit